MITETQRQAAQAIIRIFETSSVRGDYGKVTVIKGDTGHLSYGLFQTTLGAGGLGDLLNDYCSRHGARFAAKLAPYLPRFADRDVSLDDDGHLKNLLRAGADDPVMRDSQDAFFDARYWAPAVRAATQLGISAPLGVAIVFDGHIHGFFRPIRNAATSAVGTPAAAGEERWLREYVRLRREWLAAHKRADLRLTVYRMDAFQRLIDQGHWNLDLPLVVRSMEVSAATLSSLPPQSYDGPPPGSRTVFVQTPLMRGLDVRLGQLALSERGHDILADGVFGKTTSGIVMQFQDKAGLPRTGTIDPPLFARLGALDL